MKHKIFAVYDTAAETHNTPFFVNHEKIAYRYFTDAASDKKHTIGRHPEDHILFYIGDYDDETATITQDKITSCGNALNFIKEENNQ